MASWMVLSLLAAGQARASAARVLVVHSGSNRPADAAAWIVPSLVNLLGHFDCTATVVPAAAYQPGQIEAHDAVIFLGLRPGQRIPEGFLADVYDTERSVCWLGGNLDQLAGRFPLGRYGFRIEPGQPQAQYDRVVYRGQLLRRSSTPLTPIAVTDKEVCTILATTEGADAPLPYVVRSGRFWYFADMPLEETEETGSWLVLCDQLHEILRQPHRPKRTALLVITEVSAETDAGALRNLVGYLQRENLPYALAVVPVLRDPKQGVEIALSKRRAVVGAARAAQRAGAAVIAYGYSHGLAGGEGEEAEFWDIARNRPPAGHDLVDTRSSMDRAVAELARCGLYPVAWATPGGRASAGDYAEIARYWSTVWERRLPHALARRPQPFPFLIARDGYGQRVVPDNLSPLGGSTQTDGGGALVFATPRSARSPSVVEVERALEQVRCQSVVPDPWVTAAVRPDTALEAVKLLVAGLRETGYQFADLRREANQVTGSALHIHTTADPTRIAGLIPTGWDGAILGPGRRELARYEDRGADQRERARLRPGAILITYPAGGRPREVFAFEGGSDELARRAVSRIARAALIFAVGACLVFIAIYLAQVALQRRL